MSLKKLMTSVSAVAVLALLSQPASEPNADHALATTNAIAVSASGDDTAPSPDFDGDRRVGFTDFLIFAEHFGTRQGDGEYDARIDLNSDGAIGFTDFLIFAEAFGTVINTPSGFAPADQDAFDRLAVGKRILLETFFVDVVSAGRFTEGFRRHGGRYAYTNTGANTARFTQTYDDPELFGGRCTTQLTFTSPTTGTGRFACDNGATGETENWRLSDLATPMFLGAAPDTLYFAFRDTWRAGQTRAYDLQLKEKTPQGRWNDVCVTYSNRSDNTITAYARPWIYSPALAPNTTYEFRYRYRNSSSCNTGSPGPWSPIVEGATPGSGTGGGGGGGGGGGRPDLIVDAPTVSNSSPTAGASFTLSATVRNQGNSQSAATTLRFYRSTDATISGSDTEVGSHHMGGLPASGTSDHSSDLTAPSSAGTYYYGACVENVSDESDTGNNCSVAVTVTVGAPDLVVDAPTVSNSSPTAGASFTLSATVRNQGTGPSAATTLRFYRSTDATISASDTEVGSHHMGGLPASGTSDHSSDLTAPSSAGAYYYGACVESVSGETDSENNCSLAVTVTVGAPDLVVDAPAVSNGSPTAGASFRLSATVRNQGSGASAATTLRYYLSTDATITTRDTEVGTDAVGVLAAPGTSAETISLNAPSDAGIFYYGACVDAVSGESDTENNCSAAVTVTVGAPDLVVDAPTVSSSRPTAGASFTLSATVRNQGTARASLTTLRWYLSTDATVSTSDTEVGTDRVSILSASRTSAESISLTAPSSAGTYYYGACVESVSDESDTGNNCSVAVTVTVGAPPAPDLVVDAPTVSNGSPTAGASFRLSATVRNQGNGPSAAATTLRYYRSTDATITTRDTEVGTDAVGVLAAPGTSAESISLTAPSSAGTYYYGACVESVSDESDTGNNCSVAVTVTVGAPDLVVDAPTVSTSRPTAGASFTLSATVRNQGTGPSAATTLRYYRSTNATITTQDTEVGTDAVGVLGASRTGAESIGLTAPSSAGTYYYGACVESVSGETDTGNNCSPAVTVTVGAPDLVVDAPTVSTSRPTAGASFTLSATVRNQGNGQAAATTLRFYRSTDATITGSDTEVGSHHMGGLPASGTSDHSSDLTAPSSAGRYYYGACVESVSGETDTGNNCSAAVKVTVVAAPAPDLVVSNLHGPLNPTAGTSFVLGATVFNQGNGPSAATTLRFYRSTDATISASDTEVGSHAVSGLAANGWSRHSIELTAPSSAGTYYYGACVESVSGESNTGNNCSGAVTVTVVAPDLVVDAPTVSNSSPTAGASFTLNATVRNQGNGRSSSTTLRYYLSTDATVSTSDTEVGADAVSSLSASGTSDHSTDLTSPSSAGTYYYGACVGSVSGETDTGNNCSAAVSITVSTVTPPATGTSKLYWTDWGTDKIQRADLDGSNVEDLVSDAGLDGPDGLALDVSGGKLYWADSGTNKIQRANLDGSGIEDLATDQNLPFGLALDVSGGKVYWTNRYPGQIQRANLDGSGVEELVTTTVALPGALALDVAGGKMYWTSVVLGGQNKIQRADLNGANVEDLVTSGLSSPFGLALDVAGGKIYWTDRGTDKIQRADLNGANVEDLVTSGLSSPNGIALDLAGGKIYWADAETDKVQRANLDGSGVEDLLTSSDGLVDPSSVALGAEAVSGSN